VGQGTSAKKGISCGEEQTERRKERAKEEKRTGEGIKAWGLMKERQEEENATR